MDQVSIDTASRPSGEQDHDVLMLFDDSLDGVEDSGSGVNQALGMVNLARERVFHGGRSLGLGRDLRDLGVLYRDPHRPRLRLG
ncbi:hypothetical protein ACIOHS_46590 [Streptomyces sp. NPDC088253]|uniref:hypothetical protein n=1 Tax=Streptomyces sp. NPDC088253 TaxID=3365846 RepID=UPI0037FA4496